MRKLFCLYLALISAFALNAEALSFSQKSDYVSLTLIPEYKTISTHTPSITFIAEIDIKPDWHIYWDNPGDTGDPTTLIFYDSPYYNLQETTHSAPKKFVLEDIITTYVHRQKMYYKTTFHLKDLRSLKRVPFNVVLSYTACHENCFPETLTLDVTIPIAEQNEKNPSFVKALLDAENTFPIPLAIDAEIKNNLLELNLAEHITQECQEPEFISIYPKKNILSNLPQTQKTADNHIKVAFEEGETPKDSKGVLLCPSHAYYLEPQTHHSANFSSSSHANTSLFYYILTAIFAGLILNLMPCVLPILSLKALYLATHKDKASPLSALIYLCGVLSSFLLLSGILFYLKTAGTELGWGFQLQSPIFNTFLLILFFLIFLNLIDKLPLPSIWTDKLNKFAHNQSFLTGFFAVIIACPCTGPFMGAALGYAITQPPIGYFSIFISLGFGYALPYVLIEIFPQIFLHHLPKPGHWMIILKHILSVPIALTCLWLGWVIYNQTKTQINTTEIIWEKYDEVQISEALKNNEPILIDFTAKWCLTCLLNDKTVLSSKAFQKLAQKHHLRLFKADWTNRSDKIKNALNRYGRNSVPLYVYYPSSKETPIILPQILTNGIMLQTLSTK